MAPRYGARWICLIALRFARACKKISLVLMLLLVGCGSVLNPGGLTTYGKTDFHKVKIGEKDYFFEAPSVAKVVLEESYVDLAYIPGCSKMGFGDFANFSASVKNTKSSYKVDQKKKENMDLEVWYKDGVPIFNRVTYVDKNFSFWLFNNYKDIIPCTEVFDYMADSLTDEPRYRNGYGFSVRLPEGYQVSDLPRGEGIILKKTVKTEDPKEPTYQVIISFMGSDNLQNFQDVSELVGKKYPGYTAQFVEYDKFSGFYVDQSDNRTGLAVRHFYTLSKDETVLYEATLQLPSKHYPVHLPGFDALVASMRFY